LSRVVEALAAGSRSTVGSGKVGLADGLTGDRLDDGWVVRINRPFDGSGLIRGKSRIKPFEPRRTVWVCISWTTAALWPWKSNGMPDGHVVS